jgi:hypothetical protein
MSNQREGGIEVVQDDAEIEMWKIRKVRHIARKTTIDRLRRLAMLVFPVFPVFGAPRVRPLPVRYLHHRG